MKMEMPDSGDIRMTMGQDDNGSMQGIVKSM